MPEMTTAQTPGSSHKRAFGMSTDDVYFWANWVLVGSLILGVVATYAIVWSGTIRDTALRKELAAQNSRSAELGAQAQELKLKVAEAETRASEAQLALERFKAPRTITDPQAEVIRNALQPYPGITIDIFMVGDTLEIVGLANRLSEILTSSGWHPRMWRPMSGAAVGVLIVTKDSSDSHLELAAVSLANSLAAIGIESAKIPKPLAWATWGAVGIISGSVAWQDEKAAPIRMIVAAKP
jgi:hypothetical protein